ncbi:hypothetical protein GCM10010967_51760 [Dyadobacter beijingensis]|uniref:Outer membrane protein beta-barrel domain-containing protein n=1 Tax=Dyadobacter beijingensis TaxID=365489 RepID=A0ABQ2IIV7_9BACT|nr:hypothetical protein [Dyadobacter beijingensis]GGN09513.1 hypothetical protein GCM10010967_51760 [Dyadobacter beijingensis]
MKILKVLVVILILKSTVTHAQYASAISGGVDVGAAFGSNTLAPSIMYHEEIGPNRLPWLRLGLGFRTWGYYGGRANLYTKSVAGTQDFLEYRNTSLNGLSVLAGITLVFGKFDIGVDTDLAAITYGGKRRGFYEKTSANPGTGGAHYETWLATRPTIANALPLLLRRNSGQSEAFVRFRAWRTVGVKVGYTYGRVAYRTTRADGFHVYLDNNQRHVSDVYGLPYVALAFAIGN